MSAPEIFLSYAHDDREFAARVANAMTELGARVADTASIQPGDDWADAILQELRKSDVVVFIVPADEGRSTLFEVGAARALAKPIVALMTNAGRAANGEVAVDLSSVIVLDADRRPARSIAAQVLATLWPEAA